MVVELFGPLIGTEDRWREQGADEAECDLTAFSWDCTDWVFLPGDFNPWNGYEEIVIREDESEKVVRDQFGRTTILPKKFATLSLPQDFPLKTPSDWERLREWFRDEPGRLDETQLEQCKLRREAGGVGRVQVWGAYNILRNLMGDENACLAVLEEPELVVDILDTIGTMQEKCLERMSAVMPIDYLGVHEDMAGKSGPLVGPEVIRSLFNPYYRRMWSIAEKAGARIFDLDSDGDIVPIIDPLLEGGINCLHPIEPTGQMDMVKLRKKYGSRLILRGGIDKFAPTRGKAAIDQELEYRLQPCMRGGGTMFGLDHRIPGEVSIEAYRYYVKRLREILDLPPLSESEPGWCRMA